MKALFQIQYRSFENWLTILKGQEIEKQKLGIVWGTFFNFNDKADLNSQNPDQRLPQHERAIIPQGSKISVV